MQKNLAIAAAAVVVGTGLIVKIKNVRTDRKLDKQFKQNSKIVNS